MCQILSLLGDSDPNEHRLGRQELLVKLPHVRTLEEIPESPMWHLEPDGGTRDGIPALDGTLGEFDDIGEELEWAEVLGQVVLLLAQKDAGIVPVEVGHVQISDGIMSVSGLSVESGVRWAVNSLVESGGCDLRGIGLG